MAHASQTKQREKQQRERDVFRYLDTDGKRHPKLNAVATVTIVLGAIAFISAQFHSLHLLSSWTGLAGICTGLWGQMISATTGERFLLIIGIGASGVGLFLGIAHGGPFGGVLG